MSESFDTWLNTLSETIVLTTTEYERLKMAYTAGLLRAAEIAETMTSKMDIVYDENRESIAAAIRKEAGE